MSGTSMACPHVSGVAALIVSHFGGPGFTNQMLKDKLLNSSNKAIVSPSYQIGGLVDAYGAFVYGNDKAPSEVTDLVVEGRGNNIDLKFTATSDEDGKPAFGYLALYSTDQSKVEAASFSNIADVNSKVFNPENAVGELITCTIDGLEFEQTYYVKVYAYSYGRNYSAATSVMQDATTANNAPRIKSLYEGEYALYSYETLNVPLEIVEPDGHKFEVVLTAGSAAETLMYNPNDQSYKLTIKGNAAEVGTYTAKIDATDSYGLSASLSITYKIKENSAPEIVKPIEDQFMSAKGREITLDMAEYFMDPDGEQLKYEANVSNSKVLHANPKGNKLIMTSMGYGVTDVEVIGKDARGESIKQTFKVIVKDPSDPLSVYPNPVVDYLNVATLDMAETEVIVASATGQEVYHETLQASAQEPAQVDMRSCPPGTYSVKVIFGGKEYKKNVVKL